MPINPNLLRGLGFRVAPEHLSGISASPSQGTVLLSHRGSVTDRVSGLSAGNTFPCHSGESSPLRARVAGAHGREHGGESWCRTGGVAPSSQRAGAGAELIHRLSCHRICKFVCVCVCVFARSHFGSKSMWLTERPSSAFARLATLFFIFKAS